MAIGPAKLEMNPYRLSLLGWIEAAEVAVFMWSAKPRWRVREQGTGEEIAGAIPEESGLPNIERPTREGRKCRTSIEWRLGYGARGKLSHTIFIELTLNMKNINPTRRLDRFRPHGHSRVTRCPACLLVRVGGCLPKVTVPWLTDIRG
jgi:hypothetical protein